MPPNIRSAPFQEESALSKHLVIVGAGIGLSLTTARRFGQNGYKVTLIGRTPARLSELKERLESEGIESATAVADVTDHAGLAKTLGDIDAASPIDVCIFQPGGKSDDIVDVLETTYENVRPNLELLVLGSVAVGQTLAPAMIERGSGSLIFVGGGSARLPLRFFGNLGPAMAGLRNYAMTLNKAFKGTGVYSAFLTVAGMIAVGEVGEDQVDPEALAEKIWSMATEQSPAEVLMTSGGEIPLNTKK